MKFNAVHKLVTLPSVVPLTIPAGADAPNDTWVTGDFHELAILLVVKEINESCCQGEIGESIIVVVACCAA